uniref:Uncharacterized protein n=1 Tax=Aegilops tauschii subsp. strangulata TaxID=200361 RepID=A0A453GZ93_AEGTS
PNASPRPAMADAPPSVTAPRRRPRREPSEPRSESDWEEGSSSREGSPGADSADGDAVRRAARRWSHDRAARISATPADAGWWLGEIERDRVRLVRDWVQVQMEPPPSPAAGPRIRGRQARLELVMRLAADRHAELQRLSLRRAVSAFPHRNRIHVRRHISTLFH